jgi:hypothetical protein
MEFNFGCFFLPFFSLPLVLIVFFFSLFPIFFTVSESWRLIPTHGSRSPHISTLFPLTLFSFSSQGLLPKNDLVTRAVFTKALSTFLEGQSFIPFFFRFPVRLILFLKRYDGSVRLNDMWKLDLETMAWTEIQAKGPQF